MSLITSDNSSYDFMSDSYPSLALSFALNSLSFITSICFWRSWFSSSWVSNRVFHSLPYFKKRIYFMHFIEKAYCIFTLLVLSQFQVSLSFCEEVKLADVDKWQLTYYFKSKIMKLFEYPRMSSLKALRSSLDSTLYHWFDDAFWYFVDLIHDPIYVRTPE